MFEVRGQVGKELAEFFPTLREGKEEFYTEVESAEYSFLELEVGKVTCSPCTAQLFMDVTCSDVKLTQAHIHRLSVKSLNLIYFQRPESATSNTTKDAILFGVGSKLNVEEDNVDRIGLQHRVDQFTMKLVIYTDLVRRYDAAVPKPGSHLQFSPGISISQLHRVNSGLQSLNGSPNPFVFLVFHHQ